MDLAFHDTAKVVEVRLTDGTSAEVRGSVAAFFFVAGTRAVNRLRVDTYLKSVVPAEMPTSWPIQAVRAQAVAAPHVRDPHQGWAGPNARWDICDSVNCQVYRGYASTTPVGTRTVPETSNGKPPSPRRPVGS